MSLKSLYSVRNGDRAGNEPDCVCRLRMSAGLTALPNAHALTIANSMILETVHGIFNDTRSGHHTNLQPHTLRASTGKKKRQDNDGKTIVGLISGLA